MTAGGVRARLDGITERNRRGIRGQIDVSALAGAVEAVLALADEADGEAATVHPSWIRRAVAAHLDPGETT